MKVYVLIDSAYPVYSLSARNVDAVDIKATREEVRNWQTTFKLYAKMQKEIEAKVNYYEPFAVKAKNKKGSKKQ